MSGAQASAPRSGGLRWVIGLSLLITVLSVASLIYTPNDPGAHIGRPLLDPSRYVLLGTDEVGRDLLSRLAVGLALAWLPSLAVVLVCAAVGTLIGLVAGASDGVADLVLRRLIGLFRMLPAPVMALTCVALLGPGLQQILFGLAVFGWPFYARQVRAEVRATRRESHFMAVRLAGISYLPRLFRYLLPAALPRLAVTMANDVAGTVLLLSMLSYLGLGDPAPAAELGAMMAGGAAYVMDAPAPALLPLAATLGLAATARLAARVLHRRLRLA